MIKSNMTVLFVADQESSKRFYQTVLDLEPILNVPGMTEFQLGSMSSLGLMPASGIEQLLGKQNFPKQKILVPASELYLTVDQPQVYLDRAIRSGGKLLSPLQKRDWGDMVGYCHDPDGHILAFASSK